ncbi:hypothetical protein STIAU_3469, partial [Stigmatella aurantiaca DW4/3-1]
MRSPKGASPGRPFQAWMGVRNGDGAQRLWPKPPGWTGAVPVSS